MASRLGLESSSMPDPGQILIVIHDFQARSSDELSLGKGDRVELLERDDDFGDGWYLGKHLTNGNSGLFPQVYTRPAPRGPVTTHGSTRAVPVSAVPPSAPAPPINIQVPAAQVKPAKEMTATTTVASAVETRMSVPTPESGRTTESTRHASTTSEPISSPVTSPLQAGIPSIISPPGSGKFLPPNAALSSTLLSATATQDSPVMNETLSVINEHITDMNTPRRGREQRSINDSSSEYSSNIDHRMSYINGEETDEEEEESHGKDEVSQWTPDQVAEYLSSVGVEEKHCDVFREQEISGDVLLEMEQTSLFIKEFELGSVGRRLKTWQKVKALQDEVRGSSTPSATRRTTQNYAEEGTSDAGSRRSRSYTTGRAFGENPGSRQASRGSHQQNMKSESSPVTPSTILDSPSRTLVDSRPSAASIRELNHSRRNSSYDFGANPLVSKSIVEHMQIPADSSHKKQPSFDRNWTMSSPRSPPQIPRPMSSAGGSKPKLSRPVSSTELKDILGSSFNVMTSNSSPDIDRGYFSGNEADGRKRNVLRKKSSISHSRNSSYADIQGAKPTTPHSRFGSIDSTNNGAPLSASQKYYGNMVMGKKRTPSMTSAEAKTMSTSKDSSPTVTRLDDETLTASPRSRSGRTADWLLPVHSSAGKSRGLGLRAISDAITGNEKNRVFSPTEVVPMIKESPMTSPARTGSTTPSAGANSFDLESPGVLKSKSIPLSTSSKNSTARKKSKKETSAYTRGLEKKTPQEQMIGCDYSGWMKKKNTNLMTTWKSRLFILKGRRLSYYYTENDEQEQGLIDISGHRVLPAESDRLTGLHATLTGATKSPTSPSDATTMTIAATEAAAEPESTISKGSGDQMFIFKLVPPRAGQTRAVNFTKPTVHYFAVPNIKQGRLWMAALMKATIDRDDSKPITSTYQQKTISLAKARAMRHRPPALMNLDEKVEDALLTTPMSDLRGLNINNIIFDADPKEDDSGVSGINGGSGSITDPNSIDSQRNLSLFSFQTGGDTLIDEKRNDTTI